MVSTFIDAGFRQSVDGETVAPRTSGHDLRPTKYGVNLWGKLVRPEEGVPCKCDALDQQVEHNGSALIGGWPYASCDPSSSRGEARRKA